MRKILVLLSLLVIALFVVSCAPKEGDDGAIAGQAVGSGQSVILQKCTDSDNGLKYEVKGNVSGYKFNAKTKKYDIYYQEDDACVGEDLTTNFPSSNFVREMTCLTNKKTKSQVQNCLDLAPKGTKTCVNGVCVSAGVCGNKVLEINSEVCDDGNQVAGDGCSADCKSVEPGWKCVNNVCFKACTPGSTGKMGCNNEYSSYYYTKELQKEDCSKYYSTAYSDKKFCGYTADSCIEDKGCCQNVLYISNYCSGNILINATKNSCTGAITEAKTDCSQLTGYYGKKPKVCGNSSNLISCYESCTPGDKIVNCNYAPNYYEYICNSNGLDYKWNQVLTGCPTGTTCQNSLCK